jgi:hypothetical protein
MDTSFIPSPDSLQVNWLWFQVLLIFTFILHIILVNLILGGTFLAVWDRIKGRGKDVFSNRIPIMLALTINLGVPPLLFLQVLYGQFFYTGSMLMAVYWIMVIPVLILGYYGIYIYVKKADKAPMLSTISLGISTLFLLYIAFMFVSTSTIMEQPADWISYFQNNRGTELNLSEPTLWPRFLHFLIGSVAVAAIGKAVFIRFTKNNNNEEEEVNKAAIQKYLKIAAWSTALQVLVGIWFWLSMPHKVMMTFMGAGIVPTIFMLIGIILAGAILYFSIKGKLTWTLIMVLAEVFVMVLIREFARASYLKGIFHPSDMENMHQFSPLIAFLLIFALGIGAIYYMIRLSLKPKNS